MMTPRRSMIGRFQTQLDRRVSFPLSYVHGYIRTRLSGGTFGDLPNVIGPIELRIRGAAVVGKHFRARALTWKSRINVSPGGVLRIGDDFRMNDGVSVEVWHEVTIGSNVMMAPFSSIIDDHCHFIEPGSSTYDGPVVIGDNVWVGRNAAVLPGVSIGSGSIIAANSVVARDIPPNSLAGGAPARVLRTLDIPEGWTHCHGFKNFEPERNLASSLRRVILAR